MNKWAIFLAVALFALSGFSHSEEISIPRIPDFVHASDEDGKPLLVSAKELEGNLVIQVMAAGEEFPFPPNVRTSDWFYVVVDHEWMLETIDWWAWFKLNLGVKYRDEAFDCENFASLFASAVDLSTVKSKPIGAGLAVGCISVRQEKGFGGIGRGINHRLNFFVSERGLYILEPQTGQLIAFNLYPNRSGVRSFFLE